MSTENSSHSSGIIEAADDEENKADTAGDNKKDKKKKKEKKEKNGGEKKNHEACRVPVIDSPSDWYKLYGIYPGNYMLLSGHAKVPTQLPIAKAS